MILKCFGIKLIKVNLLITSELENKLLKSLKCITSLNCVAKNMADYFKLPHAHDFNPHTSVFLDVNVNGVIPYTNIYEKKMCHHLNKSKIIITSCIENSIFDCNINDNKIINYHYLQMEQTIIFSMIDPNTFNILVDINTELHWLPENIFNTFIIKNAKYEGKIPFYEIHPYIIRGIYFTCKEMNNV